MLFECAPQSGQSLMTIEKAKEIAERIIRKNPNIKFILSSNQSFVSLNPNIVDGSKISWRENAELANYCNLIVGCSSGISWLCTAQWTKPLPIIQIVNPNYRGGGITASMKIDFRFYGIETKNLIELYNPSEDLLQECILSVTENNFNTVKKLYDITDNSYFANIRFLISSRILFREKVSLFIKWVLPKFFYNVYKKIKPSYFTPNVWWIIIKKTMNNN